MSMDPEPRYKKFCKLLQESIDDEVKAPQGYIELAKVLEETRDFDVSDVKILDNIRVDENIHFGKLLNMRDKYCRVEYPFP